MELTESENLPAGYHAFFTRNFGCSEDIFASLNCGYGSGDDKEKVRENRSRVTAHFGLSESQLITAYQIHSDKAVILHAPPDTPVEADALVTNTPGLLLGILTADCTPVLFADAKNGVIGAAHAGWKGAHGGILGNTIARMRELGAELPHINAAIGPCIAQASYEVGPEFVERIADARFFTAPKPNGKSHFDLGGYVKHRLISAGINNIGTIAADTCADERRFFSWRRTCLRGETAYGRLISCIMLPE